MIKKLCGAIAGAAVLLMCMPILSSADTIGQAEYNIVRDDCSVYDNSGNLVLDQHFDRVVLDPVSDSYNKINMMIQQASDSFIESAKEEKEWVMQNTDMYAWQDPEVWLINFHDADVTYNNNNILSIRMSWEWFMGGVYNNGYYGLNYNLSTGEELSLSDVFSLSDNEITEYIKRISREYIYSHPDMGWWEDSTLNAIDTVNEYTLDQYSYYIEGNNVYICYSVYELGPGMMGPVTIACPIINDNITVTLNGNKLEFDQPPVMVNDRVLVPVRKIFETMGYSVGWDQNTQTVTATKGSDKIIAQIGNSNMDYSINGVSKAYYCDVEPQIISDRTLVPLRAVAECAGCDVSWDGDTKTVLIAY